MKDWVDDKDLHIYIVSDYHIQFEVIMASGSVSDKK